MAADGLLPRVQRLLADAPPVDPAPEGGAAFTSETLNLRIAAIFIRLVAGCLGADNILNGVAPKPPGRVAPFGRLCDTESSGGGFRDFRMNGGLHLLPER